MNLLEIVKNFPAWLLFFLSICFVTCADYFGKKWSIDQKQIYLLFACLSSLLSGFFYYPILLKEGLVVSSVIWTVLSIVVFLFMGFVVFHEAVTTLQVVGIGLGIISVILLSL